MYEVTPKPVAGKYVKIGWETVGFIVMAFSLDPLF